jgi:hypothetical protein
MLLGDRLQPLPQVAIFPLNVREARIRLGELGAGWQIAVGRSWLTGLDKRNHIQRVILGARQGLDHQLDRECCVTVRPDAGAQMLYRWSISTQRRSAERSSGPQPCRAVDRLVVGEPGAGSRNRPIWLKKCTI